MHSVLQKTADARASQKRVGTRIEDVGRYAPQQSVASHFRKSSAQQLCWAWDLARDVLWPWERMCDMAGYIGFFASGELRRVSVPDGTVQETPDTHDAKSQQHSLDSVIDDIRSSLGKTTAGKSTGEALIELSTNLAAAEFSPGIPGLCSRCRSGRNPQSSTSHYPNVFCSERCEQEFIRMALASLTLDDCIRMQARLEKLLVHGPGAAA